jgi:hypothetical protein
MQILNRDGYLIEHNIAPQIGNPKQTLVSNGDSYQIEEHRLASNLLKARRSTYRKLVSALESCSKADFDNLDMGQLHSLLSKLYKVYGDFHTLQGNRIPEILDRNRPYGIEITRLIESFLPYWKKLAKLNRQYELYPFDILTFNKMHEELEIYFFPELDIKDPIVVETEM